MRNPPFTGTNLPLRGTRRIWCSGFLPGGERGGRQDRHAVPRQISQTKGGGGDRRGCGSLPHRAGRTREGRRSLRERGGTVPEKRRGSRSFVPCRPS